MSKVRIHHGYHIQIWIDQDLWTKFDAYFNSMLPGVDIPVRSKIEFVIRKFLETRGKD